MARFLKISKEILDRERNAGLNVARSPTVPKMTIISRMRSWLVKRIVYDMLEQKQNFEGESFNTSIKEYSSCIFFYNESLKDLQESIEGSKDQPDKQNEKLSILSEDPVFIEFKDLYQIVYSKEFSNIKVLEKKIVYIDSYLSELGAKNQSLGALEDQNHEEVKPKRRKIQ